MGRSAQAHRTASHANQTGLSFLPGLAAPLFRWTGTAPMNPADPYGWDQLTALGRALREPTRTDPPKPPTLSVSVQKP